MDYCSRCKTGLAIPGRRWCLACASYMKEAHARHRRKGKPEGSCSRSDCVNQASPGRKSCDRCRQREVELEKKNRTQIQFNARQTRRRERLRVFEAYGGALCACCGEDIFEFLTIDHVAGDGAEHRRSMGSKRDIYAWLRKNNFPSGFRVLCMNCNFSLGYHGYCPHHGWTQPTRNGRLNRPAMKNRPPEVSQAS